MLNSTTIKNLLQEKIVSIEVLDEIDSTNEYLKQFQHPTTPRICIADKQTGGKARFDRQWHSPAGKNIYLSLLYPFHQPLSHLKGLSLCIGLAVCRALSSFQLFPQVKWPNDVWVDHQKIAGILVETHSENATACDVIIGIGLNINMADAPITKPWTSLQKLTGKTHDRNFVCARLLDELFKAIHQFEQKGFSSFLREWAERDALVHKTIHLTAGKQTIEGQALGVNEQGCLRVKLNDGTEKIVSSGEASFHHPPCAKPP